MPPDKSVLLEQIQTAIRNQSRESGSVHNCNSTAHDFIKITAELTNKKDLAHTQSLESIRKLEERIKSLEDQNDHLLYFIHFLYENFPNLVRNTTPHPHSHIEKTDIEVLGIPVKAKSTERNGDPYLTRREVEILQLLVKGLCAKEIASTLFICETTVITHKKNLKEKFNAKNTAELISKAFSLLFKSSIPTF
ncbi:MAG: helix-turn-helix transcriptional regulator [Chitinophagaceae bacterium]|nr:helix-turn-helix transcriptional regulator [Chitinophagaceae bacterium]